MAVFLSKNATYPYSTISVQGEFRNPIEFEVTKNEENNRDIKEARVYIVVSGQDVPYLRVYSDNQIIPGLTVLFAKDYQGNPGKYEPVLEWTNLNSVQEGRDLVIPIWIKVEVDKNVPHGLYQNNLITVEYQ